MLNQDRKKKWFTGHSVKRGENQKQQRFAARKK